LLKFKPKSRTSRTSLTDSEEMPTPLKSMNKEPELTSQLPKPETKPTSTKSEDTKTESTINNPNSLKMNLSKSKL